MSGNSAMFGDGGAANAQPVATSSASKVSANSSNQAIMVSYPGNWSIRHVPSTATQATITKAAVAGTRHVCTSITVSVAANGTAQTPILVHLRDGASGAGTILWSGALSAPVTQCAVISANGLNIVGSVNTDMTLEFAGAGVTASQEVVALSGYDCT